jgi:hypothetical protein
MMTEHSNNRNWAAPLSWWTERVPPLRRRGSLRSAGAAFLKAIVQRFKAIRNENKQPA